LTASPCNTARPCVVPRSIGKPGRTGPHSRGVVAPETYFSPGDALCWQTAPAETAEMSADRGSCALLTRLAAYGPSMIQWLSCRPSNAPTQLTRQTLMTKIIALSSLPLPPSRCRTIYRTGYTPRRSRSRTNRNPAESDLLGYSRTPSFGWSDIFCLRSF
jgi:hypothetical protein